MSIPFAFQAARMLVEARSRACPYAPIRILKCNGYMTLNSNEPHRQTSYLYRQVVIFVLQIWGIMWMGSNLKAWNRHSQFIEE